MAQVNKFEDSDKIILNFFAMPSYIRFSLDQDLEPNKGVIPSQSVNM